MKIELQLSSYQMFSILMEGLGAKNMQSHCLTDFGKMSPSHFVKANVSKCKNILPHVATKIKNQIKLTR